MELVKMQVGSIQVCQPEQQSVIIGTNRPGTPSSLDFQVANSDVVWNRRS